MPRFALSAGDQESPPDVVAIDVSCSHRLDPDGLSRGADHDVLGRTVWPAVFRPNRSAISVHPEDRGSCNGTGTSRCAALQLYGGHVRGVRHRLSLFDAIHMWTRRVPGGLAVGTVIMCVIFAATSGVVGATETVVGLLAIPAMLKYNYSKSLISGTICAGGSLGTIIPPSVLAVVIGPVANASVGNILLGMFIPGFMLAIAYITYILILCTVKPSAGPRIPRGPDEPPLAAKLAMTGKVLVPPVVVIVAVLGSMMAGVATPTEASATGALGTVLLALAYGRLSWPVLVDSTMRTVRITAMILTIVVCGQMFAAVFVGSGGLEVLQQFLKAYSVGSWGLLFLVMLIVFLAGFMLEPLVIILMVVPITMPLIEAAGFDKSLVLRALSRHAANGVSNPTYGTIHFLFARYRPTRDHAAAHVHWHLAVHRPAAAGGWVACAVSAPGHMVTRHSADRDPVALLVIAGEPSISARPRARRCAAARTPSRALPDPPLPMAPAEPSAACCRGVFCLAAKTAFTAIAQRGCSYLRRSDRANKESREPWSAESRHWLRGQYA